MALDANALVDLATVKVFLAKATAEDDPMIELLIGQVSTLVEQFLGRNLIEATYTDALLDGPGSEFLHLPEWPVDSESLVITEDDTLLTSAQYLLYGPRGYVRRVGGAWTDSAQGIKITYKAGYTLATMPRDIQAVVINKIGREWQKHANSLWGQTSRSMGEGSVSLELPTALTDDEKKALMPHQRVRI